LFPLLIFSISLRILKESFRTIESSHIVYKLQPNEKFFGQLILTNSLNESIVTSEMIQFETAQIFIKGLSHFSTSDTIVSSLEVRSYELKIYRTSSRPSTGNDLTSNSITIKKFCTMKLKLFITLWITLSTIHWIIVKKHSTDDSSVHVLRVDAADLELADYDWMNEETRDLFNKELLNLKITKHRIGREYVYEEINPKENSVTLAGMEHCAYYYITVRACFNNSYSNSFDIECSVPSLHLTQTFPDDNADKIENLCVESFEPNVFEVSWINPKRPNGAILNFDIHYKLKDAEEHDVKFECVSYNDFKKNGKKVIKNVTKGSYSVSVRVNSVAGYGTFSSPSFIEVENKTNPIFYLGAFALAIILSTLVFYLITQKRKIQLLKVTPNPLYETFIYIPDDQYELEQESVVISKELGAGHFGKVYEGTLMHEENEISVAVKTVRN
jgi:Protein tyrosine and serine/threonine kinase